MKRFDRRNPLPAYLALKASYRRRFEKALALSLLVALVAFTFSREWRMEVGRVEMNSPSIVVEEIPATRQGVRRPPPPKPAIPIPSESDIIPDDATIEPTHLDLNFAAAESFQKTSGGDVRQPRPVAFVFPEDPEKDKKDRTRGEVRISLEISAAGKVTNATVIENTTGSELCGEAALMAARSTRFVPARDENGAVASWFILSYRFGE